jgi:hypothetical protein
MTDKVCPMLLASRIGSSETAAARTYQGRVPAATRCQGHACAWYDAGRECCAVLTLARRA